MARDPSDAVTEPDVPGSPERPEHTVTPPRLLSRPIGASGPTPSLRASEAIAAIHERWADLGKAPEGAAEPEAGGATLSRRALARLADLVARATAPSRAQERELLGSLVRAVDAVAARCDELATRVDNLEGALEDAVTATSEDLVAIRAALAAPPPRARHASDE